MKLSCAFVALLGAIALVACAPADAKALIAAGNSALGSGESEKALAKFRAAVRLLDASDAQYKDARLGVAESLIAASPERANQEFLKLSAEMPTLIGERDFVYMCGRIGGAGKYSCALALAREGIVHAGGHSAALAGLTNRLEREAAAAKPVTILLESFSDCWSK